MHRERRWTVRWLSTTFSAKLVVVLPGAVAVAWAVPAALLPSTSLARHTTLSGLMLVLCGLSAAALRGRELDALTRPQRRTVATTQLSGIPSGDNRLDGLALDRLLSRAQVSERAEGVALTGVASLMVALFVTAGLRSTPWWFVAAAAAVPVLTLAMATGLRSSDPFALRRLRARVGAPTPLTVLAHPTSPPRASSPGRTAEHEGQHDPHDQHPQPTTELVVLAEAG